MTVQADTHVVMPDPKAAFDYLLEHMEESGIEPERRGSNAVRLTHEGCRLDISHSPRTLSIAVEAPSANMLFFLKEAAALHVAEVDPQSAQGLMWSDGDQAAASPVNFQTLTLVRRREVFPGMIRLTLASENLGEFARDGLHVKLMLPSDRSRTPVWPSVESNGVTRWPEGKDTLHVRYFTIRSIRDAAAEIDIDVVQHPGGMISDWARDAAQGDVIGIMGPGGGSPPPGCANMLLSGDETALPAIARILEDMEGPASGHVVVAFPGNVDPHEYLPKTPFEVHTIEPGEFRSKVRPTVAELAVSEGLEYAWFGGEFRNAQELRKLFKGEFGLGKSQQISVAYWRHGVRGDARRED